MGALPSWRWGGRTRLGWQGEITNFSAAARRAWRIRPKRHVGRPRGIVKDRISVTVRIDRLLWLRVRALEAAGTLKERSEWLNTTLREAVEPLENAGRNCD
jgi:hypothetical protein